MSIKKNIFVTQPLMPPLEEFIPYLKEIWANKILTNAGPFHQQLEQALCDYLGVRYISLFANGTIALVTALQALGIEGEVITTPYSFVASSHSVIWNGLKPVFVDIDPVTYNLDPAKIEAAITSRTAAIMPVHCYGTPCDMKGIKKIAAKHGLKVLYDAAHAFGVEDKGGSIARHGDLSVLSFHATKVFNTFEGGAIISPTLKVKKYIDRLKNFGFVDEVTVVTSGINGKMSELNAAFGLLQLKHVDAALARRGQIDALYRDLLADIPGIDCLDRSGVAVSNYAYFPVLIQPGFGMARDALYDILRTKGIYARRYFYPLISSFSMYKDLPSARAENLPVATDIAGKVLCLPIYPALKDADVRRIVKLIAGARRGQG